jgi:hypothetical protein
MATLRQTEIDEILNNDRTMNRRVLDRTIAQVQSFNDERSAPNVQDIKMEAIVGNLIDKLKASIAEALKLIAVKQFPETNGSNAGIIMGLPAGETGMTANGPNQEALEELEEIQGTVLDPDTGRVVGEGKTFDREILRNRKKQKEDDSGNQGYRYTEPLPTSHSKRLSDDLEYLEDEDKEEDDLEGGYCGGYCGGMGFGLKRGNGRMSGGDEKGVQNKKETSGTQAKTTSKVQVEQTLENALYGIINQYNAIVDKILTATDSGSVLKNKRLATASISSYFANVVQGLIEPLKHLLYELSLVRDKDTASMFTMMKSLVDNIQSAPPFQKVDFRIYKTPITDYQRLNRDLRIDDYQGKLSSMQEEKRKIVKSLKELYKDASRIEYAMGDKTPQFKQELKAHLLNKQKELRDALKQSDEDIKYVEQRKKSGLPYDSKSLKDTTRTSKLLSKIVPVSDDVFLAQAKRYTDEEIQDQFNFFTDRLKQRKEQIDALFAKAKTEVLTEGEIGLLKSISVDVGESRKKLDIIKNAMAIRRRSPEVENRFAQQFGVLAQLLLVIGTIMGKTYQRIETQEEIDQQVANEEAVMQNFDAGTEGAPAGAPGAPGEGASPDSAGVGLNASGKPYGGTKPLATLLAKPKQQYNSMGRPLSDDDKIHKQMIKANEKWQTSNPPHENPVGSKNPFYAQAPDAKYDFKAELRAQNNKLYPEKNALGAYVSLLQGAIGGPTEEAKQKRTYKKAEVETRTEAEALRNILNQNVYKGGSKKQPGALRKLVFDDDDNDLFDEEELPVNKGFIKEDKDDRFKLPDVKKEQAKKRQGRL